jgi:hypothetical protein
LAEQDNISTQTGILKGCRLNTLIIDSAVARSIV